MSHELENTFKDNLTGEFTGDPDSNYPLKYLTASSIIGEPVRNREGEHLGKIKDIMLDIRQGKIEYYVIEFGGFLGIGEKFFAIPSRLLEIDTEEKVFRFNESKETLSKAPGFDKHHWPETNEHKTAYVTYSYSFWDNPNG
ncbi:MAG: PRC-barrel domain-containing protein [Bacteroidetes bacterium]|nr:PRC-barrel domain-containing protein [Bacteroidota bacterium]